MTFATSWNALQKVPLPDICAAQWRSHNTFTSFYLTDLSVVEEDLFKIGPVVTSQHVSNVARVLTQLIQLWTTPYGMDWYLFKLEVVD